VLTHLASFSICLKLCDSCLRFPVTYCTWRTLAASLPSPLENCGF
jgi:hypothetical protein